MSFKELIIRKTQAWRRTPAIMLLALCSCFGSVLDEGVHREGITEVKVMDCGVRPFTKANRLSGCEEASSGAFIAIYRTETDALESVINAVPGCSLSLNDGVEYDIFLVGNLNGVRLSDGKTTSLCDVLDKKFPSTRSELISYEYMLDGGVIEGTGYRRETAADIASLGIPYSGRRMAVTPETLVAEGGLYFHDTAYLFAKVKITVDHSRLDHGDAAAQDWFRNVSLSTRQANARLCPFSSMTSFARASSDIIGPESGDIESCFDYDLDMPNGTQVSYVLYVPANAQGTLLEGNTDANRKTPSGLYDAGYREKSDLCTYVEFTGTVSQSAGGFVGNVKYRFYLGADACSDFSVLPGTEYHVTLTLSVEGVFGSSWKVTNSLDDYRKIHLYKNMSFTNEIMNGEMISLADEWDTDVFVRCDNGEGTDLLKNGSFDGEEWTPLGLDDLGLKCSFWNSTDADAEWLSTCGVTVQWVPRRRCFTFKVADKELFQVHSGEKRQLEIYADPGDGRCSCAFTLELIDASMAIVGGIVFTAKSTYTGISCVVTHERQDILDDPPTAVSILIDGKYIGDYDLDTDGIIDFGPLSEGGHLVDMEVMWNDRSEWDMVYFDVYQPPTVSVSFGQRTMLSAQYKDVCDDDGNPYIVQRWSWDRIWVEFSPQGRYDTYETRMEGKCGAIASKSGQTIYIVSKSPGEGKICIDFTLEDSVYTVSVPYLVYEEITFRAAEEHGALVLINNNVSVGWESLTNTKTGKLYASVRWSLSLSLICSDDSRVSGSWGPFADISMTVADGSRHVRNFHDEFKALRKSFENGHSLQDAERLEGEMAFWVTFGLQYYVANVSGATFANFSGMVEAKCRTTSAHSLLQHWMENSSRFFGLKTSS